MTPAVAEGRQRAICWKEYLEASPKSLPQLMASQEAFDGLRSTLDQHRGAIAEGLWGSSARALVEDERVGIRRRSDRRDTPVPGPLVRPGHAGL